MFFVCGYLWAGFSTLYQEYRDKLQWQRAQKIVASKPFSLGQRIQLRASLPSKTSSNYLSSDGAVEPCSLLRTLGIGPEQLCNQPFARPLQS